MLNGDNPKVKEDGWSSVGGEETAMILESIEASRDEANPSTIDKSLTLMKAKKNASEKEEEEESGEVGEVGEDNKREGEKDGGDEEKEVGEEVKEPKEEEKEPKEGDEMEPRRNDEEAEGRTTQLSVREHETESHVEMYQLCKAKTNFNFMIA
ncbi:unnamed protein product [Eruca vesicaria subsp. sativa]|uniref:Uncharacterized protein n=1 Tax=Eruca vesicaria subsp. sativa TaxID=29727 RepID=A0ABC8KLK4_ERUVS|nr:unnamed protein product [Eruca vesicaria subsp. sativa]